MRLLFPHLCKMNLTNILLGSTGVLLLVALVLSFGKMNNGRDDSPDEIAKLRREILQLQMADNDLERKPAASPSLIFPTTPYNPTPATELASQESGQSSAETNRKLQELQDQIAELTRANQAPAVVPEVIEAELATVEPDPEPVPDPDAESRMRLIRNAILQATVLEYSAEDWIAAIEPTSLANFAVGDELALRRNDGILCYFTVTKQAGGAYIVALKAGLADGAPEIVPGDELIIPPAYDGILD